MKNERWQCLDRRRILDCGSFLKVEQHRLRLPDGRVIDNWPWIVTPEYVNVVVQTVTGGFLCFRQFKYAAGPCLALVGGYLDPGEDPLTAARRELREETGYQAAQWIDLGHYVVDGNRGAGKAHLFLALEAVAGEAVESDDLEEQELVELDEKAFRAATRSGEFPVLAWSAAAGLALACLDGRKRSE